MKKLLWQAATAAALCATTVHANAQNMELVKQAAATNGGVVIVRDALFESFHQAMGQAFNAEYKKHGISVRFERMQSGQQFNLYEQELRGGRVSNDIMALVEPGIFLGLNQQDKFTPFCSPHNKDYPDWALGKNCGYFPYRCCRSGTGNRPHRESNRSSCPRPSPGSLCCAGCKTA